MNVEVEKRQLRAKLLQIRKDMNATDVQEWSNQIAENLENGIDWEDVANVHIYLSLAERHEVITSAILENIWKKHPNVATYVPLIEWEDEEHVGSMQITKKTKTKRDSHGFWTPAEIKNVDHKIKFDLILVPCLGADSSGNRIGSGRGYYDRLLKKQKKAHKIGLCLDVTLVQNIPTEKHDQKLDQVISENGAVSMKTS